MEKNSKEPEITAEVAVPIISECVVNRNRDDRIACDMDEGITQHLPDNQEKIKSVIILIVEDNSLAARAVQSSVTRLGCRSDIAENGLQAIQMVEKNSYDFILMDIGLPDMDGIETTRKIRALPKPQGSKVPIIALTGHANDDIKKQKSLMAGMQAVFNKPLSLSQLEELVQQYAMGNRVLTPNY